MITLTNELILILSQYAPDQGISLTQTVGPQAVAKAKAIWEIVLTRIQQEEPRIARRYSADPVGYKVPVNEILAEMLKIDTAFANDLQTLLIEYKQAGQIYQTTTQPGQQFTPTSSGVITQDSTQIAGKGSVVGSQAEGNIITGSGNQVIDMGGGAYVEGSGNMVGDISGNLGLAIGPGARSTVAQGTSGDEMAQLFAAIYQHIETKSNLSPQDKADLQVDTAEMDQEISKADPAAIDEPFLARRLRNIERMAPDIIDVILATLANPATGLGVVGAKVKAKAEEVKAARQRK